MLPSGQRPLPPPHRHVGSWGAAVGVRWPPSRPLPSPRRSLGAVAAEAAAVAPPPPAADLIQWPEGTRPKRGGVSRAALGRLKVADLRSELCRLGANSSGTKDELVSRLLQLVEAAARSAAPAALAPAGRAAAESPEEPPPPPAHQQQQETQQELHQQLQEQLLERRQQGQQQRRQECQQGQEQQEQEQPQGTLQRQLPQQQQQQQQQHREPPEDAAGARAPRSTRGDALFDGGHMPPLGPGEAERVAAEAGVRLGDLPPLARRFRGHVYDPEDLPGLTPWERMLLVKGCRTGLSVTLMGGAAGDAASGECAPLGLAVTREKDTWVFDAGEDLQRSLLWNEHLRPSKINRVFISRQAPEAMLGLPGLLCTVGASREKWHESADIPVHVYGPRGTGEFLAAMYDYSNTFIEMPVLVHEFCLGAVVEDEPEGGGGEGGPRPQPLNARAKVWVVLVPPDQLNPRGYTIADLDLFMPTQGRARLKKGSRASGGALASNPRAGYRPMPTPPPGDPAREGELAPSELTWTIVADEAAMVTAALLDAPVPTWGFVWREADRQGNLSVERCRALGITDDKLFPRAKRGEVVPNADGVMIPPAMVCAEDKPGRRVALLPPCKSYGNLGPLAAGADVLVADVAAAAVAAGGGPSQAGAAVGDFAQQWGVRHLLLRGMPGGASNAGGAAGGRRNGSSSNSSSSSSSRGASTNASLDEGDAGPGEEQAEGAHALPRRTPLSAEAAAVVSVVRERFTRGAVTPGHDGVTLLVEESFGDAEPPPADLQDKAATLRATTLADAVLAPEVKQARQEVQRQRALKVRESTQQQQRRMRQEQWGPEGRSGGRGRGRGRGRHWEQREQREQEQRLEPARPRGGGSVDDAGGWGRRPPAQQQQQQQQQQQRWGGRPAATRHRSAADGGSE